MRDHEVLHRLRNDVHGENWDALMGDLFAYYKPRLLRMAVNMLNDAELAEDAVSEIWIRVLTHFSTFRHEAKFSTWLYRIAMNTIIDMERAKSRPTTYPHPHENLASAHSEDPDSHCEQSFKQEWVRYALTRLSAMQRSLIMMRDIEHLPLKQIASILGIPETAVKSRLYRARKALKRLLQQRTRVPGQESVGTVSLSEWGRL
ncbi:RNA polymerase sigma factor [Sulfobacillus thermosulfidooxidans]|uniref:RNA polymerase sigma factor n=1 Tax=Sulfobacillus thermosulfidooxidans TaxID=28034 RepID=UPI0006B41032|nr:sigma-70 family RNA polymerase sigma factor [Sulfobacillus thermosulfidooxidans]